MDGDSGASEANKDRINMDADKIKRFPVGAVVQVAEMTTAGNETTITRSELATVSVVTAGLTYITVSSDLGDDYTTANNAAVRVMASWNTFTTPSWSDVEEAIYEAEDEIDNRTHTTFKSGGEVYEQYFEFMTQRRYGSYPYITSYRYGSRGTMFQIKLMHDMIKTFAATADTAYAGYTGDALAVWNGDNYEEWFNAADPFGTGDTNIKTVGRDKDFWINLTDGYLFFVDSRPAKGAWNIRIRYRHGETLFNDSMTGSAKRNISQACRLLVCMDLTSSEQYRVTMPGGDEAGRIGPLDLYTRWAATVTQLLAPHVEPFIFTDEL